MKNKAGLELIFGWRNVQNQTQWMFLKCEDKGLQIKQYYSLY